MKKSQCRNNNVLHKTITYVSKFKYFKLDYYGFEESIHGLNEIIVKY